MEGGAKGETILSHDSENMIVLFNQRNARICACSKQWKVMEFYN